MADFVQDGSELDFVPAAETAVGALVQIGGLVGIVNPTADGNPVPAGGLGSARVRGVVDITNSGVAFDDGDVVGYDATADEAVAAAGGDFDCGSCLGGAGSGDVVRVVLNAGL